MKVKDLTAPQRKIWNAARRYASAEMAYENADYTYRGTGDIIDLQVLKDMEKERQRAANRLLTVIGNSHIE